MKQKLLFSLVAIVTNSVIHANVINKATDFDSFNRNNTISNAPKHIENTFNCPSPVDTDGDGLTDCEETTGIDDPSTIDAPTGVSDPNDPCSPIGINTVDSDGDGLTDCEEITGENNPNTVLDPGGVTSDPNDTCSPIGINRVDTDGDELTDCEETTGEDDPSTSLDPGGIISDPTDPCDPIGCNPIAVDDTATTEAGVNIVIPVIANDTDPNGTIDPITIDIDPSTPGQQTTLTIPGEGTYTVNPDGTVTFDPDSTFNGTSTITYTVKDNNGNTSNAATITVDVTACSSTIDTDGDGLTDCEETTGIDDPSTIDVPTGVSDPNDPCDPIGINTVDSDGDGLTDCEETTGIDDPSTIKVPTGPSGPNDVCDPGANAGIGSALIICSDSGFIDLFSVLVGSPDVGGVFTPTLTSGTGIFDPAVDIPGNYTYTVNGAPSCVSASSNIFVEVAKAPDAGEDGSIVLCPSSTDTIDLFDLLGGTPDRTGLFTPILASGTSIFDPTTDAVGSYTYTVETRDMVCDTSEAIIIITLGTDTTCLPLANDDTSITEVDVNVVIPVISNDVAPNGTIDPITIDIDPSTPGQQTTLTIPGEGTYTVNPDGTVTFDPDSTFIGTSAIEYTVKDNNGNVSNPATIYVLTTGCSSTIDTDGDGLTNCEEITGIDDPSTIDVPTGVSDPNDPCSPEIFCPDSDSDGVDDADEDLNGNSNLDDDDTDMDGVPNYLDDDDDGDNVPTSDEIVSTLTFTKQTIFLDTDMDGIFNHIDDDDDGDTILTADEDYNNNGDPTDDDLNMNGIPDYLDSDVTLSTDEYNSSFTFSLFPNPAKTVVDIKFNSVSGKDVSVRVIDVQGKQVLVEIFNDSTQGIKLNISDLASGVYFVKVNNNNRDLIKKLIID